MLLPISYNRAIELEPKTLAMEFRPTKYDVGMSPNNQEELIDDLHEIKMLWRVVGAVTNLLNTQ